MAKDRIDRNDLADKLVETASAAEDPARATAEMVPDFRMEAGVAQQIGAERAVRHLERVDAVENDIEVLPLSPDDDRIRVATYRAICTHRR